MATEYHLACISCKEFIDIYKVRLVDTASPLGFDGIPVTKTQIEEELAKLENENIPQWLKNILPSINAFLTRHDGHQLVLVDDSGDYFWNPEFSGYCDWKEITSPLVTELYLPRNLIDDLKITSWNDAESYLRTLKILLYEELELDEYKRKFTELINEQAGK